jgi:hypothetical protein
MEGTASPFVIERHRRHCKPGRHFGSPGGDVDFQGTRLYHDLFYSEIGPGDAGTALSKRRAKPK